MKRIGILLLFLLFFSTSVFGEVKTHLAGAYWPQFKIMVSYLNKLVDRYPELRQRNIHIRIIFVETQVFMGAACPTPYECYVNVTTPFLFYLQSEPTDVMIHALYHELGHIYYRHNTTNKHNEKLADIFGMDEAIKSGLSREKVCQGWRNYRKNSGTDITDEFHPTLSERLKYMGCNNTG